MTRQTPHVVVRCPLCSTLIGLTAPPGGEPWEMRGTAARAIPWRDPWDPGAPLSPQWLALQYGRSYLVQCHKGHLWRAHVTRDGDCELGERVIPRDQVARAERAARS